MDVVAGSVGEAGRWVHHGLTSSDVLDTALGLQLSQAGHDPRGRRARLPRRADRARAREHVDTLCVGRTHGVHAEPTTFGVKLAGFAFEAHRNLLPARARGRGRVGGRAVGRGRHLRRERPGGRGGRAEAARPRARGRLDAGGAARPPRRAAVARSRWRAPGSSASPPRSGTCSAPRCARSRSRSGPARRRARRRCRTSATRSSPSDHRHRPAAARLRAGRPRERGALARARHHATRRSSA